MSNKRNARDASTSDDDDAACSHQLHANKRGRAVDGGTFLGAVAEQRQVDFGISGPARASSSISSVIPAAVSGVLGLLAPSTPGPASWCVAMKGAPPPSNSKHIYQRYGRVFSDARANRGDKTVLCEGTEDAR